MSVTLDVNGAETNSGATPTTAISFAGPTISAGLSNSALVVCLVWSNGTGTTNVTAPTTLTRGAQTLNQIGTTNNTTAGIGQVAWYGLVSPTSGGGTITGTFGTAVEWYGQGSSFQNVNQTGGTTTFANYVGASAGSAGALSLTQAITTANGDYTMAVAALGNAATTPWTTPTGVVQVYRDATDPASVGLGASAAQFASTGTSDSYKVNNALTDNITFAGFHLVAAPSSAPSVGLHPSGLLLPPRPGMIGWRGLRQLAAYPPTSFTVGLAGTATIGLRGQLSATGATSAAAQGSIKVKGQSATSNRATLAALSTIQMKGLAGQRAGTALAARGAIQVKGTSAATGASALSALGSIKTKGQASASGAASLAARAAIMVKGLSVVSTGSFIALAGYCAVMVRGMTSATGAASIAGRATIMGRAQAAASGAAAVVAHGAAIVKAAGLISTGGFVALSGFCTTMFRGASQQAQAAALAGHLTIQTEAKGPNTLFPPPAGTGFHYVQTGRAKLIVQIGVS